MKKALCLIMTILLGAVGGCQKDKCAERSAEAEIKVIAEGINTADISSTEVSLSINGEAAISRRFDSALPAFVFQFKDENNPPRTFFLRAVAYDKAGKALAAGEVNTTFNNDGCNFFTISVKSSVIPGTRQDGGAPGSQSEDSGSNAQLGDGGKNNETKPDSQILPPTCPWGSQLAENLNLGMAQSNHISGGTADEQAVFNRMNQVRSGFPIKWNDCLADLARSHAQYFVQVKQYTNHGSLSNPDGFLVQQRASAAGLNLSPLDENCLHGDFQSWLKGSAAKAVDMWMQDDHSRPILQCKEVGVGVAYREVTSPPYTEAFVVADFLCN